MIVRYIPNFITAVRIIGSLLLLLTKPLSTLFFGIYIICGFSDALDGYIARKMKVCSKFGAVLDSISDAVFIGIVLVILIPELQWSGWMLIWIGGIALIRFGSLIFGFVKYHRMAFLHTYANKVTGFLLFCSPILCNTFGMTVTVCMVCFLASISAIEELAIHKMSKNLDRDARSLFVK